MQRTLDDKICSFCGQPGNRSRRLAGGLGAMICRQCVGDIQDAFDTRGALAAKTRSVWEDMSDAELLDKLPMILQSAAQNDRFAQDWVELIRARGVSWAHIGQVLGVSRQAAWQRFSPNSDRLRSRGVESGESQADSRAQA